MNFTDIEEAVIKRLRREVSSLNTVEGYAGEEPMRDIEQMPMRLPAAFVVYEGSKFTELDGMSMQERATFSVMLTGRMTDPADAEARKGGIYTELRATVEALTNSTLGLAIQALRLTEIKLVRGGLKSGGLLVYAARFEAAFDSPYQG